MRPGRLGLRWVPYVPMRFAVSPPLSRFTGTGLSPRFWSPPLGAPIRYFLPFTFATFKHEYDGIRSLGPFVAAGSRIE